MSSKSPEFEERINDEGEIERVEILIETYDDSYFEGLRYKLGLSQMFAYDYMNNTDSRSRYNTAAELSVFVKDVRFVDLFNSMIAVDNKWQEDLLERLSDDDDAFNTNFNDSTQDLFGNLSAPEGDEIIMVIAILAFAGYVFRSKVRKSGGLEVGKS